MKTLRKLSLPIFLTCVAGIFVYAYIALGFENGGITCPLNAIFHLHCLTCGTTRAAYSILCGNFRAAFYYNALFTVGIVPFIAVTSAYLVNVTFGRKVLPLPKIRLWHLFVLLGICVAFTVFRNLTDAIY